MTPSYREELISQIPATQMLVNLGYQYLSPIMANMQRGESLRQVVLVDVLERWLQEHNQFEYRGVKRKFSENAISEAVRRITDFHLSDGLTSVNERLYETLTLGISLPQTVGGDTRHYSLQYIDWEQPENNVYHVTEEFVVERERSHLTRRPDIVCFVNGLPFAVI